MYAQSRTKAVPYGFICGFPVQGVSSELYGFYEGQGGKGGRQGEAVVAAMKQWGEGKAGTAGGTELGFPVCKRGYRPFAEDGGRRYGCLKHHELRLENMRQPPPKGAKRSEDGLYHRPGWEKFDQWTFGEKNVVSESSSFLSLDSAEEGDLGKVAVDSPAKAKAAN